jgi:hypothetical protein
MLLPTLTVAITTDAGRKITRTFRFASDEERDRALYKLLEYNAVVISESVDNVVDADEAMSDIGLIQADKFEYFDDLKYIN